MCLCFPGYYSELISTENLIWFHFIVRIVSLHVHVDFHSFPSIVFHKFLRTNYFMKLCVWKNFIASSYSNINYFIKTISGSVVKFSRMRCDIYKSQTLCIRCFIYFQKNGAIKILRATVKVSVVPTFSPLIKSY